MRPVDEQYLLLNGNGRIYHVPTGAREPQLRDYERYEYGPDYIPHGWSRARRLRLAEVRPGSVLRVVLGRPGGRQYFTGR
jgi:hypothetical protein